jgi:hypothetical protein
MSAQHTPGPWHAMAPRIGAAITIYAHNGATPIATTASNTSPLTMEMHRRGEVKANAALIAAAPELLAALREMLEYAEERCDAVATNKARAAIAKATGNAA